MREISQNRQKLVQLEDLRGAHVAASDEPVHVEEVAPVGVAEHPPQHQRLEGHWVLMWPVPTRNRISESR